MDPHSFFADPDPAFLHNADPDPAAFLMRTLIQLNKICKNCWYLYLMKRRKKKIAQKLKALELVQIYLIFKNEITITTNFLAFFCFFLKCFLLDLDPGGKIKADPDPQTLPRAPSPPA